MSDATKQDAQAGDKYEASVAFESERQARAFITGHDLDWGEEPEKCRTDRPYGVGFYATEADIAALQKEGLKVARGENLTRLGRERMSEIAKGDRFAEGKGPPVGLGRKTGGR